MTFDVDREGKGEVLDVAVVLPEFDEASVQLLVERRKVVEVGRPSKPLVHCS